MTQITRLTVRDKGVMHLATAAIVNAVWDLWAKSVGKPVWKLLADLSPEELVRCLDLRFVSDALTTDEALVLLRRNAPGKARREAEMRQSGYPACTTSAGWLGYDEAKIRRLAREGVAQGWTHFKQKVGGNIDDDMRRAAILREEIGWDRKLMMDANQVWDVDEAVANMRRLAAYDPLNVAMFDYIAVSASLENRVLEYVDHLHEHFIDPVVIRQGRYMPPSRPGYSIEMHADSLNRFEYPHGAAWAEPGTSH